MSERPTPSMKTEVAFDYTPKAPFGCNVLEFATMTTLYVDDYRSLDEAVEVFARNAMPRYPGLDCATVFDTNGVIVVGYVKMQPDQWYGIAAGFEALARLEYLDVLEVTCAEIAARQHSQP